MEVLSMYPVKKSDLGFHGNLFGGQLLKWIDAAAAGYAMQLCDTPRMVTVSMDKCFFERPAKDSFLKFMETQLKLVQHQLQFTWRQEHTMFTQESRKLFFEQTLNLLE
jgi:Thioesterase superfamily